MRCVSRGFAFAFVGLVLMTIGFCLAMAGWFTPPIKLGVLPFRLAGTIAFFAGLASLLGSCFACAIHQRRCCRRCLSSASDNTRPTARGRAKTESTERNGRMQEAQGREELLSGSKMRNARSEMQLLHHPTPRVGRAERVVQAERQSRGPGRQGTTSSDELSPSDSSIRRREPERGPEMSRARDNRAERVPPTHALKSSHARRLPDSRQRPRSVGGTRTEGGCVTSAPIEYLYISPGFPEEDINSRHGNLEKATDSKGATNKPSSLLGEKHLSRQVRGRDLELVNSNLLSGSGSQPRLDTVLLPFGARSGTTFSEVPGGHDQSSKTGIQGHTVENKCQSHVARSTGHDQGHRWSKAQSYEAGRSILYEISDLDKSLKIGQGHASDSKGHSHTHKGTDKIGHMLTLAQEPGEIRNPVKRCHSCEEKHLMRVVRNDENESSHPVSTGSIRRGINEATQTPRQESRRLQGAVRVGDRELDIGLHIVRDRNRQLEEIEQRQRGLGTVEGRDLSGLGSLEGRPEGSGVKYRRVLCPVHDLPQNWRMSNA